MTSSLEILAINEAKLDDSFTDGEISISGYTIERKDRNRYGGGVALYVRENLSYTIREDRSHKTTSYAHKTTSYAHKTTSYAHKTTSYAHKTTSYVHKTIGVRAHFFWGGGAVLNLPE